jgi:hypothetical protein
MLPFALLLAIQIAPSSPDTAFRQPQLAADGRLVAVTFGSGDAVYFASSADGGKSFSTPTVVSRSGKLSLGMHRGPRVAVTPQGIVVSAIVGEKGRGADGDIQSWRSTDGGRTWSAPMRVNDVSGSAREGLHAMAYGGGVLFAAWLDLREKGTRIYGAASKDGGKSWSENRLVYESPSGSVCECCHPSVAVDGQGRVSVMFRNAVEGSRDLYLVRSSDGGQTFGKAEKLGKNTWKLNACPMDGGGVAFNSKGQPVTAWRREKEVYTAAPGEAEQPIGLGKDPAIAVGRRGTYFVWTAGTALQARVPGQSAPMELSPEGSTAQLLTLPDGSVLAGWERKGILEFRVLP